ncbi:unnamed protein product [Leptosia nina]|uniref:Uncharacterized protein n=1 Tax=Leptosia nina TaxID=320188 RepID=A0AAV1JEY1_9NEOP
MSLRLGADKLKDSAASNLCDTLLDLSPDLQAAPDFLSLAGVTTARGSRRRVTLNVTHDVANGGERCRLLFVSNWNITRLGNNGNILRRAHILTRATPLPSPRAGYAAEWQ